MHVSTEILRKRWEGRLSRNREVSTPCNLQGSTKPQPDSKPQGTGRDFPSLEMDWRWTDYDICKKRIPTLRQKQVSSGQTVFIYHRGQVSWFPNAWPHCDRNDSVMVHLWTESDTEVWEASSRQRSNLEDPLPALNCIRNYRQNTYLSDPHLRLWCYSSLWNPARQNRALPGISSQEHWVNSLICLWKKMGKSAKALAGMAGEDDTRKIWMEAGQIIKQNNSISAQLLHV